MEGCPLDVTKEELQAQLNSYYNALVRTKNIPEREKEPLNIVKINIGRPFYLLDDALQDK